MQDSNKRGQTTVKEEFISPQDISTSLMKLMEKKGLALGNNQHVYDALEAASMGLTTYYNVVTPDQQQKLLENLADTLISGAANSKIAKEANGWRHNNKAVEVALDQELKKISNPSNKNLVSPLSIKDANSSNLFALDQKVFTCFNLVMAYEMEVQRQKKTDRQEELKKIEEGEEATPNEVLDARIQARLQDIKTTIPARVLGQSIAASSTYKNHDSVVAMGKMGSEASAYEMQASFLTNAISGIRSQKQDIFRQFQRSFKNSDEKETPIEIQQVVNNIIGIEGFEGKLASEKKAANKKVLFPVADLDTNTKDELFNKLEEEMIKATEGRIDKTEVEARIETLRAAIDKVDNIIETTQSKFSNATFYQEERTKGQLYDISREIAGKMKKPEDNGKVIERSSHTNAIYEILSTDEAKDFVDRYNSNTAFKQSIDKMLPKSKDISENKVKIQYMKNMIENPMLFQDVFANLQKGKGNENLEVNEEFVKAVNKQYEKENAKSKWAKTEAKTRQSSGSSRSSSSTNSSMHSDASTNFASRVDPKRTSAGPNNHADSVKVKQSTGRERT